MTIPNTPLQFSSKDEKVNYVLSNFFFCACFQALKLKAGRINCIKPKDGVSNNPFLKLLEQTAFLIRVIPHTCLFFKQLFYLKGKKNSNTFRVFVNSLTSESKRSYKAYFAL